LDIGQAFLDRTHDPSFVIEWTGLLAREAQGSCGLHGALLSSSTRIGHERRGGNEARGGAPGGTMVMFGFTAPKPRA